MRNDTPDAGRPGRVAGVVYASGFPVDALLCAFASNLSRSGVALAGVVQFKEHEGDNPGLCVRALHDGWELPILEDRGRAANGCRLDPQAIAEVAGRLEQVFTRPIDLMIINRFGRAESEGRGLRHIIERAASNGIPLLVGVREDFEASWRHFHGGLGSALSPDAEEIARWWRGLRE